VDIDASRSGAADYLIKAELNASILERSIRYALSHAKIIRELDEKEKKYRLLFEHSIDPIFLANQKFRLLDVNNSFLTYLGYPDSDASGITLEKIFYNDGDFDYFKSTLMESEQIRDFEVTLRTKLGDKKVCLINCVFIPDQSDEFCCYQGILHDLTLRKQAELDMLIAERLSLTGKIARTMAHEVRNPLTNLNLALDQLKSEMPQANESVKLYSDIIERNANRIEQLVGEMLSSSRPKELFLKPSALTEVLNDTIELAIDRIKLNQIKLNKNYAQNLPFILADKEKIQIALLNIIINATEAVKPGVGMITIEAFLRDQKAFVEISDNGRGIGPADIKKLFDPFFTGKQSGMGLGLTSTKNILDSHHAKIEVRSEPGKGTSFSIQFETISKS
jgi:PAS domain S-box-containing protein